MGREREDFADAVREAGRQANTADLATDIEAAIHQADRLTRELHDEKLWRRRFARAFAVYVAFVVVVLGVLVYIASLNARNGRILVECTTPSRPGHPHECYEDGQRRTAAAVDEIVRALSPTTTAVP